MDDAAGAAALLQELIEDRVMERDLRRLMSKHGMPPLHPAATPDELRLRFIEQLLSKGGAQGATEPNTSLASRKRGKRTYVSAFGPQGRVLSAN